MSKVPHRRRSKYTHTPFHALVHQRPEGRLVLQKRRRLLLDDPLILNTLEPSLIPRPQQPRQRRRLLAPRKGGGEGQLASLLRLCRRQDQATDTQSLPIMHERADAAALKGRRTAAALLHSCGGGRHGLLQARQLALDLAGFVELLLPLLSLLLLLQQEGAVVIDAAVTI